MTDESAPDWSVEYAKIETAYRAEFGGVGLVKSVARRFNESVSRGDLVLPLQFMLRCPHGHPMILGALVASQAGAGEEFFVPEPSTLEPLNGVWRWRLDGYPEAVPPAVRIWGSSLVRLACPSCDYSPQVHWPALNSTLKAHALAKDFAPILKF